MIRIFSGSSILSAKLLATEINRILGVECSRATTKPERMEAKDKVVRYGNSTELPTGIDLQLNSCEFIRLASNKLRFSRLMEKYGIYSPSFYQSVPERFPVVLRTTLTSFKGKGIFICKNRAEFNANWQAQFFWTPYIETAFELRVHVLGGKIARIFKKVPIEQENDTPIRTLNNGYHFSLISDVSIYKKVLDLIAKMKEIPQIGTRSYFAADIGWDKNKKEYFIFEINSAPGLNEHTAREYANFILNR